MSEFIPLSVPVIKGNEWQYIKECLDTGWVSSAGKYVEKFEETFSAYTGAKHSIACVNGTAALHVSLQILGVVAGDEVIVPTLTFIASVNSIHYTGASPVFMDCDDYYNIDVKKTCEFLTENTQMKNGFCYNKKSGAKIPVLMIVHVFGNAVDLNPLVQICREKNIKLLEDATESLGTRYTEGSLKGKHTGITGDIGCFSFNGNKIITTGGGGMIVTANTEWAKKARYLTTQAKDDETRFIHNEVGYNYRMTNLQAAMGVAQMELLPGFIKTKKENYLRYKKEIEKISGLKLAAPPSYAENNLWMYALQIESNYGKNRETLMQELAEKRIQTRPLWQLNHLQKPYVKYETYKITKALTLYDKTLNIPCSSDLSQEQLGRVVEALKND